MIFVVLLTIIRPQICGDSKRGKETGEKKHKQTNPKDDDDDDDDDDRTNDSTRTTKMSGGKLFIYAAEITLAVLMTMYI